MRAPVDNSTAGLAATLVLFLSPLIVALEPEAQPATRQYHTTHRPASYHNERPAHARHHLVPSVHGKAHLRARPLAPGASQMGRENVTSPATTARARQQQIQQILKRYQQQQLQAQRQRQEREQARQARDELQQSQALPDVDEVAPLIDQPVVPPEPFMPPVNLSVQLVRSHLEPGGGGGGGSDEDRELLCLFRVYMDSFVAVADDVDMNDRLVFLVPLIIIYWRHRHPHSALPAREIDALLRDIGQEGLVQRLVLRELVRRVSIENECGSAASRRADLVSSASSSSLPTSSRAINKQAKALEAMRILREWLDEEERLEEQTARQSGARGIRHWFAELLGANRRRAGGSSNDRRRPPSDPQISGGPETHTRPPQALLTQLARDELPAAPVAFAATTELPFGLPQYGNRTGERWAPTSSQAKPFARAEGSSAPDMSHLLELSDLVQASGAVASTTSAATAAAPRASSEQQLPPTHYSEFFDLVSSIIDEINHLHNSTSGLPAEAATEIAPSTNL